MFCRGALFAELSTNLQTLRGIHCCCFDKSMNKCKSTFFADFFRDTFRQKMARSFVHPHETINASSLISKACNVNKS